MTTAVTSDEAQELLALMLSTKDVDVKTAEVQKIKGQIKRNNIQSEAITTLCEALRLGLASTNLLLFQHSFSCISHVIKRLVLQEPHRLRPQCSHLLPLFCERLGDQKPRISAMALTCLVDMYKACPQETEKTVKELGMGSKNPRAREQSVQWLLSVYRSIPGFSFRSFTPFLMKMLEDADAGVRDLTKDAVVELFSNAPDHAKADLKKELVRHNVRKAIATHIVSQLGIPGGAAAAAAAEGDGRSGGRSPADEEEAPVTRGGPSKAASVSGSMTSSTQVSSLPGSELEPLDPEYVNTNKELEEIFQDMVPSFDGRESEQNWLAREKNCTRIRRLARGNAYKDYQQTFLAGVRSLLDGILKAVNSLRTTLSTNGCQLVKDLAIICGPGIDPMVEILLVNLIKLCANTKKITAQMGQVTTSIVLANVSYHPKILNHIWLAVQDKNVQPRLFTTAWLKIILEAHMDHKGYLEHTGGLDTIEKCIKKGLGDANPGVREGMRGTFWKFAAVWPDRADVIMDGLDNTTKKLLEKENPNAGVAKGVNSLRAPGLSRTNTAPVTRPSIKEAIMAQKRQQAQMAKLQRVDTLPMDAPSVPLPATAAPAPAGISSAPVRPQRPRVRAVPEGATTRSTPANVGNGERLIANRAVSPSTTHSSSKETPVHFSRRSPAPPSSPPQTLRMAKTPVKAQTPQPSTRKLTLMDQLNHSDWRVRVEGIVTVACILAKKTPPNYDGSKLPSLPPSDALAPVLQKLFNDPQPEVVEHVVAPEVLAELVKVVPIEQIVPKVLLLSEGDDEDHSQPIMQSSMPALKSLLTQGEATRLLFQVLTSTGAFGTVPKKFIPVSPYSPSQKKKIIHGCLVWLIELVALAVDGHDNEFLKDMSNYQTYVNRLIAMLNQTKPPNYMQLALLLKGVRKLNVPAFDKILSTFERQIVRELKKAWGQPVEEEEYPVMEEKVAHVQEVLGEVPLIRSRHVSPGPVSPRLRKRDFSPAEFKQDATRSVSGSLPPKSPQSRPKSAPEDKENKEAQRTKSPDSSRGGAISPEALNVPKRNGASVKVYEDATVFESNGAVATADKQQQQGNTEWYKTKMKKQISTSNLPKTPENTAKLLTTLVQRLRARDIDTQALRKLIGIAREHPVRVLQENNGEPGFDIWNGGRMFDELLTTLLEFLDDESLDPERSADLRVQGLLVLKQLLSRAAPYFSSHEAAVLRTLIDLRGKYPTQSHVTTGIEEISEEFMNMVDPVASIDAILNIIHPEDKDESYNPPIQSWCMGLKCLATLIRSSKAEALDKEMSRLGQLALKSLDAQDAEIRKSCVSMCVELNSKIGDSQKLFDEVLKGLTSGHQNLLTYYFAKKEKGG
ncbi:clasp N terminal-domain-containing protein [Kalaharituber pfeilii]|nr:clasp N terminal-domain-containing protein [Kalaharituber pfeilii]